MRTPLGYWMLDNASLFRYAGELQCMREGAGSVLLSGSASALLSGVFRAMYGDARIVAVSDDREVLDDALSEDGALVAVNEPFASYDGSGFDIAVSVLAINALDTRELTPYLFGLYDALLDGGNLYLSFPSTERISPYPKKLVDAWYAMDEKVYMKRYVPEDVLMALSMIGFSIRAIEKDESADLGDITTIHAQKMAR